MRRSDLLVVTDLDGCLLDPLTYSHDAARPALAEIARTGTPLVLCSGKTRAEIEVLSRELALQHPFIVENGGGIIFPPGSFDGEVPGAQTADGARVLALGAPRADLVVALRELADQVGVRVRGFEDLGAEEIARLTGLTVAAARLASERDYDEPFVALSDASMAELARAAEDRGLRLTHGGRFHHLMGGSDKGLAVRTLLALYQRAGKSFRSVGIGDAETDLSLLQSVDRPILVPRPDGSVEPLLASHLPDAERAPGPGPSGWNLSILAVLEGRDLPRLGTTLAGEAE